MSFPPRTLDTVCELLLDAFRLATVLGEPLYVADDLHDPKAVGDMKMPALVFDDPSAVVSNWQGWEARYVLTVPAKLYLRRGKEREERNARRAVDDLIAHSLRVNGLPVDAEGKVQAYSEALARLSAQNGKIEFYSDRTGPRVQTFKIETRVGSPYGVVTLAFVLEFLAEYDPRKFYHAKVMVIGATPRDGLDSDGPAEWVPLDVPALIDVAAQGRHDSAHPLLDDGIRIQPAYTDPVGESPTIAGNDLDNVLVSIDVIPRSVTLAALATQQCIAIARYASDAVLNVSTVGTWASSDATKATVNSTGLVTAVASGTANITCAWLGITSSACVVTVS